MKEEQISGWVLLSYHCPISLDEYLAMPRWDRFIVHKKLGDFIERSNGDGGGEGSAPPTRQQRREGVF